MKGSQVQKHVQDQGLGWYLPLDMVDILISAQCTPRWWHPASLYLVGKTSTAQASPPAQRRVGPAFPFLATHLHFDSINRYSMTTAILLRNTSLCHPFTFNLLHIGKRYVF